MVYDPRRHQVLLQRDDIGNPSRAVIAATGYQRIAVNGKREVGSRPRSRNAGQARPSCNVNVLIVIARTSVEPWIPYALASQRVGLSAWPLRARGLGPQTGELRRRPLPPVMHAGKGVNRTYPLVVVVRPCVWQGDRLGSVRTSKEDAVAESRCAHAVGRVPTLLYEAAVPI